MDFGKEVTIWVKLNLVSVRTIIVLHRGLIAGFPLPYLSDLETDPLLLSEAYTI